jgi:type 1 glutamine amidotransferase
MKFTNFAAAIMATLTLAVTTRNQAADWASYQGKGGPGTGKRIVFVTGDEEYRSEEVGPMLAKILSVRHGFNCTVLFALNPQDGTIDPMNQTNIVGLQALRDADMMVLFTRFRELPDAQMKYFADFVNSGKPILGIRTATHAFDISRNKASAYAKYDWRSKEWPGGFGQQVLGDTWVNHHGNHGHESTRGVINQSLQNHPILKGVGDIWGPTDVYTIAHLPANAQVLVWGQVLEGMKPTDKPVTGPKNDPMMPIIWVRDYSGETGKTSRIICSTIGAAVDFESEGLRRLLVNACYWGLGLEDKIPAHSDVAYVGEYKPTYFGSAKFTKGVRPADLELK